MDRRSLIGGLGIILAAPGLSMSPEAEAQTSDRRDGTWWRGLEPSERLMLVIGFLDGIELGNKFSYWGLITNGIVKDQACFNTVKDSFLGYADRYFKNVTAGQLSDGMTAFYADYRNRSLTIPDAVWLVLQGISGVPADELEKKTENFRKHPG